jgi:hypothetical protein
MMTNGRNRTKRQARVPGVQKLYRRCVVDVEIIGLLVAAALSGQYLDGTT